MLLPARVLTIPLHWLSNHFAALTAAVFPHTFFVPTTVDVCVAVGGALHPPTSPFADDPIAQSLCLQVVLLVIVISIAPVIDDQSTILFLCQEMARERHAVQRQCRDPSHRSVSWIWEAQLYSLVGP